MDLSVRFNGFVQQGNLFQKNDPLLLAVSGGVDSVVLCALCHQANYTFSIAHCNFQLRGEDSERDEQFTRQLAASYGVPFFIKRFDTHSIAKSIKKSVEETARDLRYAWFYELAGHIPPAKGNETLPTNQQANQLTSKPINHILTAHHADDNIETAVMNFFRGTGIAGIRGMLPKQGKIIRPLLFARRAELEHFAADNQLDFVTDTTNFQNDYTRNFFRNKILPLVMESFPEAPKNIINNIHRFTETEQLYQQAVDFHKSKLVEKKGSEFHIPVLKLLKTKPLQTILYEIIKDFGFTAHQSQEAVALLQSETGKFIRSTTHRIIKNRKWLIITPNQTASAQTILIEPEDNNVHFEGGILKLEKLPVADFRLQAADTIAQLDATAIKFPLLLRKWRQGDYFYPLGMEKKKKLSRFFTDQKLSLPQKENTWVVEMDRKIIWVVGMRIDNRFKINPGTKTVYLVQWFKNVDASAG